MNHAGTNGALVVAAAGNLGLNLDQDSGHIQLPAQCGTALSVSATAPFDQTDLDRLTHYSNHGRSGAALAAPGGGEHPSDGGHPAELGRRSGAAGERSPLQPWKGERIRRGHDGALRAVTVTVPPNDEP